MEIKAIETSYKGYKFRSRLEARYAIFFDSLGWKWEYEPEGFDLLGEYYLPDFILFSNEKSYWVEVKPQTNWGIEEGDRILKKLVTLKKEPALLLSGAPLTFVVMYEFSPKDDNFNHDWAYRSVLNLNGNDINEAINKARSARFEYKNDKHL